MFVGYKGYKDMSRYVKCNELTPFLKADLISGDLNSAIEKCNNDTTCEAIKDWTCDGNGDDGNFYRCKGHKESTEPTTGCDYVKGTNFPIHEQVLYRKRFTCLKIIDILMNLYLPLI